MEFLPVFIDRMILALPAAALRYERSRTRRFTGPKKPLCRTRIGARCGRVRQNAVKITARLSAQAPRELEEFDEFGAAERLDQAQVRARAIRLDQFVVPTARFASTMTGSPVVARSRRIWANSVSPSAGPGNATSPTSRPGRNSFIFVNACASEVAVSTS